MGGKEYVGVVYDPLGNFRVGSKHRHQCGRSCGDAYNCSFVSSASLGAVRVVAVESIHRRQGRSNPRIKNVTTFAKYEIMMTIRLLVLSFDQEGGHWK